MAWTSAGSPSMGISRGQVNVGRRASPGSSVGRVVDGLLRRRQFALDAGGQDALDEDVFLQDDFLAGGRTHGLEDLARRFGPTLPGYRADERFHIDESADLLRVAAGTVESERRAPIVRDEGDVFGERERFQPGVEVADVVDEAVAPARVGP